MMKRWKLVLPLCVLLLSACGGSSSPETGMPLLRAEPDPIDGGRIVDRNGREVILRGVNMNSFVDYWSGNDFPTTFPFTEADAERMAGVGWNVVRLLMSWSRIEPEPGIYDEAYLNEIGEAIAIFERHGIKTPGRRTSRHAPTRIVPIYFRRRSVGMERRTGPRLTKASRVACPGASAT